MNHPKSLNSDKSVKAISEILSKEKKHALIFCKVFQFSVFRLKNAETGKNFHFKII